MEKKLWAYIPVSSKDGELQAKIDSEDFDRVMKHKWRAVSQKSGRFVVATTISTPQGRRQMTLGRFLMNPPKGKMAYPRRFNDGLDYRKENLVVCSMAERQQLLPKSRKEHSSRYKGVSYDNNTGQWRAALQVEGETIHLGLYNSEESAAFAYNEAARQHFGEFAYQNQVSRPEDRRLKAAGGGKK